MQFKSAVKPLNYQLCHFAGYIPIVVLPRGDHRSPTACSLATYRRISVELISE